MVADNCHTSLEESAGLMLRLAACIAGAVLLPLLILLLAHPTTAAYVQVIAVAARPDAAGFLTLQCHMRVQFICVHAFQASLSLLGLVHVYHIIQLPWETAGDSRRTTQ